MSDLDLCIGAAAGGLTQLPASATLTRRSHLSGAPADPLQRVRHPRAFLDPLLSTPILATRKGRNETRRDSPMRHGGGAHALSGIRAFG